MEVLLLVIIIKAKIADSLGACGDCHVNLLKPTGHVMHQQFNFQQSFALSTPYLCALYFSQNKQQLLPHTK
jgi:hypothetical protein